MDVLLFVIPSFLEDFGDVSMVMIGGDGLFGDLYEY